MHTERYHNDYDEEYGDYADRFVPDRQDRVTRRGRRLGIAPTREDTTRRGGVQAQTSRIGLHAELVDNFEAYDGEHIVDYFGAGSELLERSHEQMQELIHTIGVELVAAQDPSVVFV